MSVRPLRMGEAMKRSGLSRKLLRRYCQDGTLAAKKLENGRGGDWLIDAESFESFLAPDGDFKALEIARSLGL